jgi:uncharacterized membrane protein YfcA
MNGQPPLDELATPQAPWVLFGHGLIMRSVGARDQAGTIPGVHLVRDGLLLGATAVAGAVNAIAGGGTLLSFPAALAWGLSSPVANATNALAMCPGSLASAWAYRRELAADRSMAALLLPPTIVGAALGAALMRVTPVRTFDALVPVLVFGATLALLLQGVIVRRPEPVAARSRGRTIAVVGIQLLIGAYGGYFGAAMGIVMLASLALVSSRMQARIALKNLLAAVANGVASVYFIVSGLVDARAALLMVPAALAGGFAGGHLARRASPRVVRMLVVAIGLGVSALLGYRALAHH